jgi:hypothetical protein
MFTNNSSIDRATGRRNAGSVRRSEKKKIGRGDDGRQFMDGTLERHFHGSPPSEYAPTNVATLGGTPPPGSASVTITPIRRFDCNAIRGGPGLSRRPGVAIARTMVVLAS